MSSADDFVDEGSVEWSELATAVIGTWITAMILYWIEFVQLVGGAAQFLAASVLGWYADLIEGVFAIPASVLDAAWGSAASFVELLGPFALPVAGVIAFSTAWLLWMFLGVIVGE